MLHFQVDYLFRQQWVVLRFFYLTFRLPYILNPLQVLGVQSYVGFDNFLESFLTLFRQSTGEDWHKIMFDTTRDSSFNCTSTSCGNCKFIIIRHECNIFCYFHTFAIIYHAQFVHSGSYAELRRKLYQHR